MHRRVWAAAVAAAALALSAVPAPAATRDVNGDGFDDVPVGRAVVFGKPTTEPVLGPPFATGAVTLTGAWGRFPSLWFDGDLTGDLLADVVINGSGGADGFSSRHVWIVPGRPNWPAVDAAGRDPGVTRLDASGSVRGVVIARPAGDVD